MPDLNFDLEVIALSDDLYSITAYCPDGEFVTEALFPKEELRAYTSVLNTAITTENAKAFGQRLFQFLIDSHAEVYRAYHSTLKQTGNQRLFIRLSTLKAGRLAVLPWEYLCNPDGEYIALSPRTPLIRCCPDLSPLPPAGLILPLRVLVVIAAPPNYPGFDAEAAWMALEEATVRQQETGHIQLERLARATWPALRRKWINEDYQVLHYIGYTEFDDVTQHGFLALEDETFASGSRPTSAGELSGDLGCESTIRLIVCDSRGETASKANFALATQFLHSGTPAVLTTQSPVPQTLAANFSAEVYAPLCEGHPVEAGVNIARRSFSNQGYWGAWALFLRARNGNLFRRAKLGETDS